MLHNKSYTTILILFAASLFINHCICSDRNDSIEQIFQSKSLSNKPQTSKTSNITVLSVDTPKKQNHSNKSKSKIQTKKYKKLNETELLKTLPLQFAQDLSLQLPDINFGSYIQSALGTRIKGASSKVLLKIHKGPDAKGAQKSQSIKARSVRSTSHDGNHEFEFEEQESQGVLKLTSSESSQKPLKRTKRQTPCTQGEELDDYVDQLFRFGTRIVRAMEPITLPNATIDLVDYNIQIFLYEGKGTRAYKFKRTKPAWVFCSNETISLGLTIEVEELRVAYKYRVISGDKLIFDGDLEARLSPKLQAQFSQAIQPEDSEEPVMQRVDRIRVFRLGRVHVVIRGLGNLTQSLSMIINSYLNDNQEELQPTFRMVEGDAVKMINKMLANVNVPLLNVV